MSYLFALSIEIEAKVEFGSDMNQLNSFASYLKQDSRTFEIDFSVSHGVVDNDLYPDEKDHVLTIRLSQDELQDQVIYSLLKMFEAKVQLYSILYQFDYDFHFEIEPMVKQE